MFCYPGQLSIICAAVLRPFLNASSLQGRRSKPPPAPPAGTLMEGTATANDDSNGAEGTDTVVGSGRSGGPHTSGLHGTPNSKAAASQRLGSTAAGSNRSVAVPRTMAAPPGATTAVQAAAAAGRAPGAVHMLGEVDSRSRILDHGRTIPGFERDVRKRKQIPKEMCQLLALNNFNKPPPAAAGKASWALAFVRRFHSTQ